MSAIFYHFTDEVLNNEFKLWKQNMLDGELLVYPYVEGTNPSEHSLLLLSDIQASLDYWTQKGGCSVGYEHDSIRLTCQEIVSDIEELYPEDLSDIEAYASEKSILSFFSGDFDFYRLGYEDYRSFYKMQCEEPYLLPDSYKHLTEEELHLRYQRDISLSRLQSLYTVYGFAESGSEEMIGYIAIEPSLLSEEAANLSYYIIPKKRAQGIATNAVKAFLNGRRHLLGSTPLLAVIHRSNKPSVRLAKRCGFAVLSKHQQLIEKLPEGFFTMIYDNSADT